MNDNFYTGWIKLFRSTAEKGWYKKSNYVHLWLHLLLKANHKSNEYFMNGQTVIIERGQLVTSRKMLSEQTGIKEGTVERILKFFINEQQIEQQANNRNRIITILSYELYQESEQQVEQQTDIKRTPEEQPADTNKNVKKEKNVKNEKSIDDRKQSFRLEIEEINTEHNILSEHLLYDMADGFIPYWTATSKKGYKMEFEKERTWNSKLRMFRWKSNAKNWNKDKKIESNGTINKAFIDKLIRDRTGNN